MNFLSNECFLTITNSNNDLKLGHVMEEELKRFIRFCQGGTNFLHPSHPPSRLCLLTYQRRPGAQFGTTVHLGHCHITDNVSAKTGRPIKQTRSLIF